MFSDTSSNKINEMCYFSLDILYCRVYSYNCDMLLVNDSSPIQLI